MVGEKKAAPKAAPKKLEDIKVARGVTPTADLAKQVEGVQFCFGFKKGVAVFTGVVEAPIAIHPGLTEFIKPLLPDGATIVDSDKDGKPEFRVDVPLGSPKNALRFIGSSLKRFLPPQARGAVDFVIKLAEGMLP